MNEPLPSTQRWTCRACPEGPQTHCYYHTRVRKYQGYQTQLVYHHTHPKTPKRYLLRVEPCPPSKHLTATPGQKPTTLAAPALAPLPWRLDGSVPSSASSASSGGGGPAAAAGAAGSSKGTGLLDGRGSRRAATLRAAPGRSKPPPPVPRGLAALPGQSLLREEEEASLAGELTWPPPGSNLMRPRGVTAGAAAADATTAIAPARATPPPLSPASATAAVAAIRGALGVFSSPRRPPETLVGAGLLNSTTVAYTSNSEWLGLVRSPPVLDERLMAKVFDDGGSAEG